MQYNIRDWKWKEIKVKDIKEILSLFRLDVKMRLKNKKIDYHSTNNI